MPGSAWGSDCLGGWLWSVVGAWDLVLIFWSKSQLLVCGTCLGIPGSAWGSDCLGGWLWSVVGAWDLVLIFLSKSQLVGVEPV